MFGQLELAEYLASHPMPATTRELVEKIRRNQSDFNPFNHQGTRTVVTIRSAKMQQGVTVQSRTLHASAAMWYEFDEKIQEYYANVHSFTAITQREDGSVANKSQHWFDFLILGDGAPRFEDWKEETVLFQMQKKEDDRWKKVGRFWRDECDRWHDRACEQYCGSLGIAHQLRTNREIPRRFLENIRYLRDFYDPRTPVLSSDTAERLRQCVQNGPVSYDDMMKREGFQADVLLSAIVQGVLFVDLNTDSIGNPADLLMHRDADLAEADRLIRRGDFMCEPLPLPGLAACPIGTRLQYGGEAWTVILGSTGPDAEVLLTSGAGGRMSLPTETARQLLAERATDEERVALLNSEKRRAIASLSRTELKDGIKKYKAVILDDGADQYSDATLGRSRQAIRDCTFVQDVLLELAPHHAEKGNRLPRLPPLVELLAKTTIETVHNAASAGNAKKTYDTYCEECIKQGVVPMSYPTLCQRVKAYEDPNARFGKRVAYRDGQIPLILDAREPVDGVAPHEVCYIDHTEPNLFTKGPEGQDWGKLWLSAAVDGNVTCARAFYLSYRPPSALSVLMTLRDYVRRWRRLPRIVVFDGGADMRSHAVEQFCKIHNIDVRYRAGGRPRGGKDVERLFGLTEEELLSGLEGCSIQLKEARTVTKSVDPTRRAVWTFPQLYRAMESFLFDFRYRRHVHPGLGMTQCDYEQARLEQTGRRDHIRVEFDENLLLLTAPSPPRSEHKVHAQRGVWESGMFYWHAEFAKVGGKPCPVRYEPWLANVIYVYVGHCWVTALARDLEPYWGRTRYEVEYAKRMERNFNRLAAERDRHTTSRAVRLGQVRTPISFDETTAKKQKSELELYKALGMGTARAIDLGMVPRQEPACSSASGPDSSEVDMAPDAAIARAGGEAAAELAALSDPTSSAWSEPDEAGLL
ncbi:MULTISPECIES: integrase catalytic domain-containing protein [Paraburkholderia]|jgi:putative transposase|uniref:Integrase core domain-containing protein n=1 Tax=Paraburkholderia phenazinium TaxID=60549 RepID=A0A1N6K0R6_9BURK|nr:DDE-type integrase/transposase/recombinase [Paraburkholderia phenazinium]SIO50174.1 Integrase core domain-containing protein [Paraburkholderia phenazinium]